MGARSRAEAAEPTENHFLDAVQAFKQPADVAGRGNVGVPRELRGQVIGVLLGLDHRDHVLGALILGAHRFFQELGELGIDGHDDARF